MREIATPLLHVPRVDAARELGDAAAVIARRLSGLVDRMDANGDAQSRMRAVLASVASPIPVGVADPMRAIRHLSARHPLLLVARAFGLSELEIDVLLLAGLPEQHETFAALFRALHPRSESRPTVALAAQLCCANAEERPLFRRALEEGGAVTRGVLELQLADAPFVEKSLTLAPGIWSALLGQESWPQPFVVDAGAARTEGLEEWLARPEATAAQRALQGRVAVTVLVTADSEFTAFDRAAALCAAAGVHFTRVAVQGAATVEHERRLSLLALAHDTVPLLRVPMPESPSTPPFPGFASHPGPVVLAARAGANVAPAARSLLIVPFERPSIAARVRMWRALMPELGEAAEELAARYALEPAAVADVALDLRRIVHAEARPASVADVVQSVRARASLGASSQVQLVRPRVGWESLVVSPDRLLQLREAVGRVRHQGEVMDGWRFLHDRTGARGVRLLFAGPPGTGKTLSAEVIAKELGTDLLVVDISKVVSKWIGETERNLAEVFDAAERTQSVLFFDEADALFGRRTEVSDAHDRYANLETAYLLTRLERFDGLAILSTNLRQNIDSAFMRRLEFVVDFEEPAQAERAAIWRAHVPPSAPLHSDVDFQELATLYPIVGGLIRNAAVAAAFLAAAEASTITRAHFVRAIRREYEKSGRAFPGLPAGMRGHKP